MSASKRSSTSKKDLKRKPEKNEENEEEPSSKVAKREVARGLKTSQHGVAYQLNLLMLFFKRAADEKKLKFELRTEWDQAEKFDDVVLAYERGNGNGGKQCYQFLQAKHKLDETKTISVADLLNKTDGNFSLLKYFRSFVNIKAKPIFQRPKVILKSFILCTNIGFKMGDSRGKFVLNKEIFGDEEEETEISKLKVWGLKEDFAGKSEVLRVLRHSSPFHQLASALAKLSDVESKLEEEDEKILNRFRFALAEKVIDFPKKKFRTDFIEGKNLENDVNNVRNAFLAEIEYRKNLKDLKANKVDIDDDKVDELVQFIKSGIKAKKVSQIPKNLKENVITLTNYIFEHSAHLNIWKFNSAFLNGDDMPNNVSQVCENFKSQNPQFDYKNCQLVFPKYLCQKNFYNYLNPDFTFENDLKFVDVLSINPDCLDNDKISTKFANLLIKNAHRENSSTNNNNITTININKFDKNVLLVLCRFVLESLVVDNDSVEIIIISSKFIKEDNNILPTVVIDFKKLTERKFYENEKLLKLDWKNYKFKCTNFPKFKLPKNHFNEPEANEFLKKLKFAVNQPNVARLEEILREECPVKTFSSVPEINYSLFREVMYTWLSESKSECLTMKHFETIFSDINCKTSAAKIDVLSDAKIAELMNCQFKFAENSLQNLRTEIDSQPQFLIIKNPIHFRFSSRKIYQLLKVSNLIRGNFLFTNISTFSNSYDDFLQAVELKRSETLVLEDDNNNIDGNQLLLKLLDKLKTSINIILITHNKNISLQYQIYEDNENCFDNFSEETREKIWQTEIKFQGKSLTLKQMNKNLNLNEVITGDIILQLFNGKKQIEISRELESLGDISSYYIERKLRRNVEIVEECLNETDEFFCFKCSENHPYFQRLSRNKRNLKCGIYEENEFHAFRSDSSNHWIEIGPENKLIWISSNKSLANLRKYITKSNLKSPVTNLIENDNQLVIISANPGMGKSTLLTQLALRTQMLDPSKWIIKLNARDILDQLENNEETSNLDETVRFLIDISQFQSEFEKVLLKNILISGSAERIIVLFDGLDEILPPAPNKILRMAENLVKAKAQVWLSSRIHLTPEIEEKFCTFSYELVPFSRKDQATYLRKFWIEKLNLNEERGKIFVDYLIDWLSKSMTNREKEFMGIALQTRMIADIYQKDFEMFCKGDKNRLNSIEQLNILQLYQNFIDVKLKIYVQEKCRIRNEADCANEPVNNFIKEKRPTHRILALFAFYGRNDDLQITDKMFDQLHGEIDSCAKMGLVSKINRKPVFVHATFAEYFVFEYFADQISQNKLNRYLQNHLYDAKHQVVRHFFDLKMLKDADNELLKAALNDDLESVRSILKENPAKISQFDSKNRSILHLSAALDSVNICQHVLQEFNSSTMIISINQPDNLFTFYPLTYSVNAMQWETSTFLLDSGFLLDDKTRKRLFEISDTVNIANGDTLLHHFVRFNYPKLAEIIVKNSPHLINLKNKNYFGRTPLNTAVKYGYYEISEALILNGANVTSADDEGNTPLHEAAIANHVKIIKLLLQQNGIKIHALNNFRRSPLYVSVEHQRHEAAETLIENGADVNMAVSFASVGRAKNWSPLHVSAYIGNVRLVQLLLANGADKEAKDDIGRTALVVAVNTAKFEVAKLLGGNEVEMLHSSAFEGNLDYIKNALENKNEAERREMLKSKCPSSEWTVMHRAAQGGHVGVAEYFLSLGLDIDMCTADGTTSLHEACRNNNLDFVKFLVDRRANVHSLTDERWSPLHAAAQNGASRVLKFLLIECREKNIIFDENMSDVKGTSLLHTAAFHGQLKIVEFLVGLGADVNISDAYGATPFFSSLIKQCRDISEYFLNQSRIRVNCTENTFLGELGIGPLHLAAAYDDVELMKRLVERHKMRVNAGSGLSVTSLHVAALLNSEKAIAYLVENGADQDVCVNKNNIIDKMSLIPETLLGNMGAFSSKLGLCILKRIPIPLNAYALTTLMKHDNLLIEKKGSFFSRCVEWISDYRWYKNKTNLIKNYIRYKRTGETHATIDLNYYLKEG